MKEQVTFDGCCDNRIAHRRERGKATHRQAFPRCVSQHQNSLRCGGKRYVGTVVRCERNRLYASMQRGDTKVSQLGFPRGLELSSPMPRRRQMPANRRNRRHRIDQPNTAKRLSGTNHVIPTSKRVSVIFYLCWPFVVPRSVLFCLGR